ncbi:mCG62818 [Mus musculus]|nr:mCG62818 [Mus musculus]
MSMTGTADACWILQSKDILLKRSQLTTHRATLSHRRDSSVLGTRKKVKESEENTQDERRRCLWKRTSSIL